MTDEELLKRVTDLLIKQKLTVATAESCTGGLIAHTLTNVSGSSEYYGRGIISYSNTAKMYLLDVPENLLKEHGAVSEPVARLMADNIRTKSNVDIGIATTGIAGPTGGTKNKPVGLVFIAVSTKTKTIVKKFNFKGNRLENKNQACKSAIYMLIEILETK